MKERVSSLLALGTRHDEVVTAYANPPLPVFGSSHEPAATGALQNFVVSYPPTACHLLLLMYPRVSECIRLTQEWRRLDVSSSRNCRSNVESSGAFVRCAISSAAFCAAGLVLNTALGPRLVCRCRSWRVSKSRVRPRGDRGRVGRAIRWSRRPTRTSGPAASSVRSRTWMS